MRSPSRFFPDCVWVFFNRRTGAASWLPGSPELIKKKRTPGGRSERCRPPTGKRYGADRPPCRHRWCASLHHSVFSCHLWRTESGRATRRRQQRRETVLAYFSFLKNGNFCPIFRTRTGPSRVLSTLTGQPSICARSPQRSPGLGSRWRPLQFGDRSDFPSVVPIESKTIKGNEQENGRRQQSSERRDRGADARPDRGPDGVPCRMYHAPL